MVLAIPSSVSGRYGPFARYPPILRLIPANIRFIKTKIKIVELLSNSSKSLSQYPRINSDPSKAKTSCHHPALFWNNCEIPRKKRKFTTQLTIF